ncbi:MAG TPA: DUF2934 domain-containing protein [Dissulfurispiraceae bacterium]|nr:DUF2934 domain-containing protein [Dissulfurispiraceae bacterium]
MKDRCEIERIAYELFQKDGCIHGRDLQHWFEAEMIVLSLQSKAAPDVSARPVKAAADPSIKKATANRSATITSKKHAASKSTAKGKSADKRPRHQETSL